MTLFDMNEVLEIEHNVIEQLEEVELNKSYFKEPVAQHLYKAWKVNHSDTRILAYAFPMISYHLVKRLPLIQINNMEQQELFNALSIIILEHLPKYKETSGTIYAYFNMVLKYKVLDIFTAHNKHKDRNVYMEDDIDEYNTYTTDNTAELILYDVKQFLNNLKREQNSKTLTLIIDAMLRVIDDNGVYHCQDRKMLTLHLVKITGYSEELIQHLLNRIAIRYQKSVLD